MGDQGVFHKCDLTQETHRRVYAVSSCHVFAVAEYRFGNLVDDYLVKVKGYSTLGQDRNTAGGGVLLYVRNDVKQGYW